jgi:hypothetical protein
MQNKSKIVLFLGKADTEGVTVRLKAVGTLYKRKMLESRVENWRKIIEIFNDFDVSSVIVKLTGNAFLNLCDEEFKETRETLLGLISSKPNLFLAHESLLTEEVEEQDEGNNNTDNEYIQTDDINPELIDPELAEDYEYQSYYFYNVFDPLPTEVIREVTDLFTSHGITIIPYKKNIELVVIASKFVEQNDSNLIFRIYVPSERMWANEAEKLLQLFREYLHKVSGLNVRQEQHRTNQGVVYEFFGGDGVEPTILPQKFTEFSSFMEMCVSNPEHAQLLLESTHLNKTEVFNLVERYSREARRLHVDIKQERERKLLAIRHVLESELSEYVRTERDWEIIGKIIDESVPAATGVSSALSIDRRQLPEKSSNIIINVNPQIIGTIHGVVAQQILGDQHLGTDAKQLLEIIEAYAGTDKTTLTSAVHELSDESATPEDKLTAKHKLKGFLYSAAGKIGSVALDIAQKYIEKQVGL